MKLRPLDHPQKGIIGYEFFCPACDQLHWFSTTLYSDGGNPVWAFNGDMGKPTFTPSLKMQRPGKICHLTLIEGNLAYQNDCTHALKGKTVPLPEFPERFT